ncbi:hypothetical protein D7D52_26550 [Nocardia yunnanensis]|uniref:Uncharacterized protein n=1 Tax=Nocardia yunnanensis TaxID=2382165 RepID=A0A386ZHW2_9NOCA|nr:hypothetical protein [Nocardia yunnanensis]AYF76783.1 hypothetical protein D7D52_26550 [Nocardia yunnanensis]
MTDVVTRAQVAILAMLLEVDPTELAGLERLGAVPVMRLRERISEELFDTLAPTFARVSKLAPITPNALAITVAQKAIPPRVAGLGGGAIGMDHPDRATGILGGMSPSYLADAAPYLDPRVIPVFAPKIPAELLIPVAEELLRRGDYLTASRFVEQAPEELVRAFDLGLDDDEGLIRTAALLVSAQRLSEILRTVRPARRERMITSAAAGSPEAIVAALSTLARIDHDLAAPLSNLLFSGDADSIARVLDAAITNDAVPELLDLTQHLTADTLDRIAATHQLDAESSWRAVEQAAIGERRRAAAQRLGDARPKTP